MAKSDMSPPDFVKKPDVVKNRERWGLIITTIAMVLFLGPLLFFLIPFLIGVVMAMAVVAVQMVILAATVFLALVMLMKLPTLTRWHKALARKLTARVVKIAPIEFMQEQVEEAQVKFDELKEQVKNLVAVRESLSAEKVEQQKMVDDYLAQIDGLEESSPDFERTADYLADAYESATTILEENNRNLDKVLRIERQLKDNQQRCHDYIQKKRRDIKTYEQRWRAAQATQAAAKNARAILGKLTMDEAEWRLATDFIDEQDSLALAEIDMLETESAHARVERNINRKASRLRINEIRNRTNVRVDTTPEKSEKKTAASAEAEDPFHRLRSSTETKRD